MTDDEITRAMHGDRDLFATFVVMLFGNLLIHTGTGAISHDKARTLGRDALDYIHAPELPLATVIDLMARTIQQHLHEH